MRRMLVALAMVLVAVPGAQAAGQLSVTGPVFSAPQPVEQNVTVPVTVSVPCDLLPNGTTQEGDVALLDAPTWLVPNVNATRFRVGPCGQDPQEATVNLSFRLTPEAPAFASAQARLLARVRESTATAPFVVIADGFALVDVQPDQTIRQAGPQSVATFPIHVRNLGNGLTRVTLEVGHLPEGWSVLAPQPLTLQARQNGGLVTEGTVNVVVQTPHRFGFVNDVAQVPVWINASLVAKPDAKDHSNVTLVATAKGFDAPGPEGALLLAPLAVAALLVARRRR